MNINVYGWMKIFLFYVDYFSLFITALLKNLILVNQFYTCVFHLEQSVNENNYNKNTNHTQPNKYIFIWFDIILNLLYTF